VNVGISAVDDVGDDIVQSCRVQFLPVDLATHLAERFQGLRVADGDLGTVVQAETAPGRLRKPCLVRHQQVVGHLIQRRDDRALAVSQADPVVCGEALRAADVAIFTHEHDGLVLGVDTEAPGAQGVDTSAGRAGMSQGVGRHVNSASSRYSGTVQGQPSSSSMRWRRASDADGSP